MKCRIYKRRDYWNHLGLIGIWCMTFHNLSNVKHQVYAKIWHTLKCILMVADPFVVLIVMTTSRALVSISAPYDMVVFLLQFPTRSCFWLWNFVDLNLSFIINWFPIYPPLNRHTRSSPSPLNTAVLFLSQTRFTATVLFPDLSLKSESKLKWSSGVHSVHKNKTMIIKKRKIFVSFL